MTTHDLNALAKTIHENAVSKGFWDEPRNTGEVFMLIVSELGEAQEAHRKGRRADMKLFAVGHNDTVTDEEWFPISFVPSIKDSFEDEIADVVIRILDWCWFAEINVKPEYQGDLSENIGENLLSATKLIASAHGWVNIGGFNDNVSHSLNEAVGLLFNLADQQGFDLYRHIELKMKYNATRERLHSKKY